MTVRFLTVWKTYQPGDTASLGGAEAALISGGLARDASENDNTTPNLTDRIGTLEALVDKVATNYADDAAAATGGVEIGSLYNTIGTVKVRAS